MEFKYPAHLHRCFHLSAHFWSLLKVKLGESSAEIVWSHWVAWTIKNDSGVTCPTLTGGLKIMEGSDRCQSSSPPHSLHKSSYQNEWNHLCGFDNNLFSHNFWLQINLKKKHSLSKSIGEYYNYHSAQPLFANHRQLWSRRIWRCQLENWPDRKWCHTATRLGRSSPISKWTSGYNSFNLAATLSVWMRASWDRGTQQYLTWLN